MRYILLALLAYATSVQASGTLAVYDVTAKRYVYESNIYRVSSMASITKLMTAMVVLDADQDLTELVPVRGREQSSRIRQRDRISRQDLLELTLVSSDNLAANTLLEHYPGGVTAGIRAMNLLAHKIGAEKTTYVDASGLQAGNTTTAADLVKILLLADTYPVIREMSSKRNSEISVQRSDRNRTWYSRVQSLATNPYAKEHTSFDILVAKTGLTRAAGWCFAVLLEADRRRYVIITLGNTTKESRRKSLDFAVSKISRSHLLLLQDYDAGYNTLY